jgi:hypothetical protein
VATYFIPNEFCSVGNVFPPAAPSIEYSIENPNFGYDVEADRLIQILLSNQVRDSVTKKFDLLTYYQISKDDRDWLDRLIRKYKKDITFERTPSMSILIKAQTRDPEMAANVVNYIIHITDVLREKLYKQNISIAYKNALTDFEFQKARSDSALKHLLQTLKENKMSSMVLLASNAQISIDMDKLNSSAGDNLTVGSEMISFKNMRDRYLESEGRVVRFRKALSLPVPTLYVIDKAEPRFKKVFPSYLLNAAAGMVLSCVILVIGLLAKSIFDTK